MPELKRCHRTIKNKGKKITRPGYKACDSCFCYTYTPGNKKARERAKRKAIQQMIAIKVNQKRK